MIILADNKPRIGVQPDSVVCILLVSRYKVRCAHRSVIRVATGQIDIFRWDIFPQAGKSCDFGFYVKDEKTDDNCTATFNLKMFVSSFINHNHPVMSSLKTQGYLGDASAKSPPF